MRKLFILLFFILSFKGYSQVLPPELKCIQSDTLRWSLPNNSCGAFLSYLVYGSKNINGPYVLLSSITNPAQKKYFHAHPTGEVWYYFLQSKFNCPGIPVLNSDTLTGGTPKAPKVQSVSVENGTIEVKWDASATKNVIGYIIYKQTASGIKPIDTVFNATKFVDKNVMPDKKRENYFVIPMDFCGNTSLFEKSQSNVFLKAEQDACNRNIALRWENFKGWANGASKHEIWVKRGTSNYLLAGETLEKDTFFVLKNIKDNEKYCFYIKSIQKDNPKIIVKTNESCIISDIIQPTTFILVKNVSIDSKGDVTFSWAWNNDADLDSIKIKKSIDGKNFKDIASLPTKPLNSEISFTDKGAEAKEKPFYYGIYSLDKCDSFLFSPFFTLNIKGKPADIGINNLTWGTHYVQNVSKIEYELYRIVNGVESQVWTSTNENEYNDKFDQSNDDNAKICYYVVAYAWDTLPNGKPVRVRSSSNTTCVEQTSGVFVPNAFAPRSYNQEFRPLISFSAQIKNYELTVFDRFGSRLFEGKEYEVGWNGKVNNTGKEIDQGVYTYFIKIVQNNGKTIEKKGTVFLMR